VILYSVQCYALHWTDNDAILCYIYQVVQLKS